MTGSMIPDEPPKYVAPPTPFFDEQSTRC